MSESQPSQASQPAAEQSQVQQLQQQQQQQPSQQPTANNIATYTNNSVPIAPSSGSSPRTVPNSPLTAQQLTGQPIPQNIVIPQGMPNAGQYVQFMFAPPNPGIAMPTGGVNFTMAPQRPPAAHSGVGPRSPAMLGVVPPSPGTPMGGMHLVSPPASQQPLSLAAPSSKSPVRPPTMSQSVANVTGQRLISAESLQQMQQMQQQFQQQQQQQQQQSMHQHSQQHHSQQQPQQQQQQAAKFYIRPIGSGMQLVSQQPSMSSQGQAMQGQSPIGTVAPSSQHQMMTHQQQQQQQQIISTQAMLASQPIYGQIIPQAIPLAHQQYQGQAVLTSQPMYVRPSQPPMQPIHPVNMAPKVGRPRLDQSQRKTPPGVSLAAKRQATGQARVTPIASRSMNKSYTPPMNLTVGGRQEMMPKQIRARFKSPAQMVGNTAYRNMANVVRVPQPNFTRLAPSNPAAQESRKSTTGLDSTRGSTDLEDTSPCQDMPQLVSTASQPLANGDGGGDKEKQKAVVKPQTLTHVIDGFVIEEGPLAFPVQASSLLTDTSDMPPKLSRVSPRESEEEVFKPASTAKAAEGVKLLKCEFCGKVDKMNKFRRSMRFCSVGCAKRYNVNTRHKGLKKAKQLTAASSMARKKKQMLMKRTWTRGQGRRMAVARLPQVADQADDERSTTSSSSSSHPEGDDRSTIPSPPQESQEVKRNNPAKWTVQEVYDFVKSMGGCEPYADLFKSQEIDGQALMLLKEDHLMSAMNMKLGPALKICARINSMKTEAN